MGGKKSKSSNKKMVKFVCISDTHTMTDDIKLPKGDVLIHAGDFTFEGKYHEIEKFKNFLKKCDFEYKIIIAGNHDLSFDEEFLKIHISDDLKLNSHGYYATPDIAKELLSEFIYLENTSVEVFGYKIWGSPVVPKFYDWAFMKERGEDINKVWEKIPDDTDILITYGPPYGILDKTFDKISVGCEELYKHVTHRIKPKYHIFGHIHEAYGKKRIGDTVFINSAICNLRYKPDNKYYEFELEDKSI